MSHTQITGLRYAGGLEAQQVAAAGQILKEAHALELVRSERYTLHSRKLRSFDEPPFR
ncbi:hypothetical protein [Marinobacter antarcticus]|uniref:hypothetical protein n=1 Tax=Marinobacter antarcticus TaxID=564117 RepID=UPI001587E2E4|nr:hypothetical protein [Marinobacter antarcticus]